MSSKNFSQRLSALRTEKGLSKSGLARALGVTPTCVWNWEEGNTHPRADALARLAAKLGTTPEFLELGSGGNVHHLEFDAPAQTRPGESVAEVVRRAREAVAAAAGLSIDQVRITIEYGG